MAFQQALAKGHRHENIRKHGRRLIATKLAEIVSLDCWGANPPEFPLAPGGSQKATQCLPYDHTLIPRAIFRLRVFDAILAGGGRNSGRPTGALRFTLHRPPAF